jgi:hypothetical protein
MHTMIATLSCTVQRVQGGFIELIDTLRIVLMAIPSVVLHHLIHM